MKTNELLLKFVSVGELLFLFLAMTNVIHIYFKIAKELLRYWYQVIQYKNIKYLRSAIFLGFFFSFIIGFSQRDMKGPYK